MKKMMSTNSNADSVNFSDLESRLSKKESYDFYDLNLNKEMSMTFEF
jgi:hypothetical protein